MLAHPAHGNLAVALLARRPEALNDLVKNLKSQVPDGVIEAFPSDTSPDKLRKAFADIKGHESFKGLKLNLVSLHRATTVWRDMQCPMIWTTILTNESDETLRPGWAFSSGYCRGSVDTLMIHAPVRGSSQHLIRMSTRFLSKRRFGTTT